MYEVLKWSDDCAPDAVSPYFVANRSKYYDFTAANRQARLAVETYGYVGAGVFQDGKLISGYGLTLEYVAVK